MPKFIDNTGQTHGRLTVICRATNTKDGHVRWRCRCDCGNETIVQAIALRSGATRSCGCLLREVTGRRSKTHGHAVNRSHSVEYAAWCQMIQRCTNPNNKRWTDYGGRGITVCPEWRESFEAFFARVGPRVWATHS